MSSFKFIAKRNQKLLIWGSSKPWLLAIRKANPKIKICKNEINAFDLKIFRSKNKHFKRSCKKDNFWDYEIDKLVELFEGKSKNSAFKYWSPRENILDVNQVYTHRSANSWESNDFNSSQKSDWGK